MKANCPRKDCQNTATLHPVYGVIPCKDCQKTDSKITLSGKAPEFYSLSKQDRFQRQRDEHYKDVIQPWDGTRPNKEFVEAYPQYRDEYFNSEELRKL
jgi:hypothetical protein